MPAPDAILAGLTAISNEWRSLAIGWHVVFGLTIAAVLAGYKPSQRAAACGLTGPLVSVSALAWHSGNPFNAFVFALLALVVLVIAATLPADSVRLPLPPVLVVGGLLLLFAWVYPHFIMTDRWMTYFYGSPLGLIPCPTLAAVIGTSLVLGLFRSAACSAVLVSAGVGYGVVGVFRLNVTLDYGLLAGAAALALVALTGGGPRSVPS